MSLFFADEDNITFGVQGSNVNEVAQFSSTTDDVFLRFYTNNYSPTDNLISGTVIGSSNYDKSAAKKHNLYIGHVSQGSNLDRVVTVEEDRVGIRTTTPTATLHVVGSNLSYSNVFLVQTINSPAYPAIVVDKYGYVGVGTTPNSNAALVVKGNLIVDHIQVGGTAGDSSRLITTYGLEHPLDVDYLDFDNSTMSNISNVVTPLVEATNLQETFANIANYSFLDKAAVSISGIDPRGYVTFVSAFKGNSPTYTYTLTAMLNGTPTSMGPYVSSGASDTRSVQFSTGSYQVNIRSYATNGVGSGSYFNSNNIASFAVGATDPIGTPTVSFTGTPTFSGSSYTYVSGVPYYTSGIQISMSINTLVFNNIYNVIDPTTALTNVLTIQDATNNSATTNYTYSQVFNNFLVSNSRNDKALTITLTSPNTGSLVTLSGKVYNINYQNGNTNTSLISDIAYVGSAVSESSMQVASYTGMPITSVKRVSIDDNVQDQLMPAINLLHTFSGVPSGYDSLYSPYSTTFVSSYNSLSRGTYAPSYTAIPGAHNFLTMKVETNAAVSAFVLNMVNASGVEKVMVQWESLGTWYDAMVMFNAGGCAGSTYVSGTRFPIRLPEGLSISSPTNIYINVRFTGSVPLRSGNTYRILISNA
jgi:hypothetical protein